MIATKKYHYFLKLFFIASFLFILIGPAHQALGISIIDPGNGKYNTGNYELNDFIALAINVSNIILGIIGSISLAIFVYAGFLLIFSGGSSDKVGQAKKAITAAVIGLLITLGSYNVIKFTMKTMGVGWYGNIQMLTPTTTSEILTENISKT